jgi:catechol 2,3-dioxygenase-like lactoylglutathione lyase family enzyme
MSTAETTGNDPAAEPRTTVAMKLEVVALPVSDVDRAKAFYTGLGWREDADFDVSESFRVVQLTPPGSPASVHFGRGITTAAPGSAQHMYLVVDDLRAARAELIAYGADVGEIVHSTPGAPPADGPDPEGRSYASFASFADPDGNQWVLQEITERRPGR